MTASPATGSGSDNWKSVNVKVRPGLDGQVGRGLVVGLVGLGQPVVRIHDHAHGHGAGETECVP